MENYLHSLIQLISGDFFKIVNTSTFLRFPPGFWHLDKTQISDSDIVLATEQEKTVQGTQSFFYFHATQIQVNVKFPNRIEANYNFSQSRDDPSYAKTPQVWPHTPPVWGEFHESPSL